MNTRSRVKNKYTHPPTHKKERQTDKRRMSGDDPSESLECLAYPILLYFSALLVRGTHSCLATPEGTTRVVEREKHEVRLASKANTDKTNQPASSLLIYMPTTRPRQEILGSVPARHTSHLPPPTCLDAMPSPSCGIRLGILTGLVVRSLTTNFPTCTQQAGRHARTHNP